ncbi:MAG: T9SS type A sorting domain-containing protein [Nonlabens sp.]
MKKSLLIISFIWSLSASAQIYVDASATGANNGSSWADAYINLNDALANDVPGDEIWISAGTYTPGTTITSLFSLNQNGVKLYGGFNGTESMLSERDPSTNITILSGDLNSDDTGVEFSGVNRSDNAARVLVVNNPDCLIDGLTITGGHAVGANSTAEEGSAIYINNANFTIKNCVIKDNVVSRGGVIRAIARFGNLQIEESIISNNLGTFAPVFYGSANGTLNVNFINCLINNNRKEGGSGASPGLMWYRQDTAGTIRGTLTNCTVVNNTAQNTNNTTAIVGTRLSNGISEIIINNSIFQENMGISSASTSMMTSVGNGNNTTAANLYGVRNSIDETAFSNIVDNGGSRINNNNSSANPSFTSATDFTLTSSSPAIDAGDNNLLPAGVDFDLQGNDRIFGLSVDIGAYEFDSGPVPPIYVDINATGNNDGTSWADAFTDLNTALSSSQTGQIGRKYWIAAGNYIPGTSRTNSFALNVDETALFGGFDGTETTLSDRDLDTNLTILSGDLNGDDGPSVVYNSADRNDNSLSILKVFAENCSIDGLTISGGQANDTSSNLSQEGAAIDLRASDFSINKCMIEKNAVQRGGVIKAINVNGTINITNTIMSDNLGRFAPLLYARAANADLSVNLENCLIINNQKQGIGATDNLGFFWFRQDNSAQVLNASITNCTIANNTVNVSGTNTVAVSASQSNGNNAAAELKVYNSIFDNNVNITNTTTEINSIGNGSSQTAANIYEVRNSLDHNAFTNIANNGTTRINMGNSSANPMFISATDFSLQSGSPAIDAGDNQYLTIASDLAGNNRIANNTVDMGAYEFGSTAGIGDAETDEITVKIYPNPATTVLQIDCGEHAFAKAELYNLQGQFLKSVKQTTIDLTDLDSGIYFIKVSTSGGGNNTIKMIKR